MKKATSVQTSDRVRANHPTSDRVRANHPTSDRVRADSTITPPTSSYARFWAAFNALAAGGCDREDLKRDLVLQFSLGRTDSLRQLTTGEYLHLCEGVESLVREKKAQTIDRQLLRRERSITLHQLQLYGINTLSWPAIDTFCLDHRIAGKKFAQLTIPELKALTLKMRAIRRKKPP